MHKFQNFVLSDPMKFEIENDGLIIKLNTEMNLKPSECYENCNKTYTAMNPGRLFCKKGCDFD